MRFVAGRGAAAKSHLEDVAGRCADAEVFLAVGTMEKRHREADAGRGAAAESHLEDVAGRGADEQDAGSGRRGEEASQSRCWLKCREETSGSKGKEKSRRKVLDQPALCYKIMLLRRERDSNS